MAFDPNKPYEVEGGGFDPSKPFTPVKPAGKPAQGSAEALWLGFGVVPPEAPKPKAKPPQRGQRRSPLQEVNGALANLNRGLLIGDEVAAGVGTAADVLTGKTKPRVNPGENPMGMVPALRGMGDAFQERLRQQRALEDDFSARRPNAAAFARGTGSAATVAVPAGTAVQTTSRLGAAVIGATAGATQGAAAGLMDRGTLEERIKAGQQGAVVGGVAGGFLGGVFGGPKKVPSPKRKPVPTADDLRTQKAAAYQAADEAGVQYAPEAIDGLVASVTSTASKSRLNPMRHPKAASMLQDMQGLRGQSLSLTELDQLRQVVRRDVANAPDEAERFFGQQMIDEIDNFINGSPKVSAGSAEDAASLIGAARDANTRYRKVRDIEAATGRAERRAGSTGSGGNSDNALRQNIRGLREKGRNYSPAEIAAMDEIIMGTRGQNLLRQVGKLSPQGNGLMAGLNLGAAAFGGPLGAVPGVAGMGSKVMADRITRQKVDDLLRLVAQGGAPAQAAQTELAGLAASDPALAEMIRRLARGAGSAGATANPPRRIPQATGTR